ncbi:MAG TPA: tetratricopeptide repeat protein [Gammaproteobacteria bacterium]|nr:tetratricopeptide repeat protein [Gammaproteobacteria bacterium]
MPTRFALIGALALVFSRCVLAQDTGQESAAALLARAGLSAAGMWPVSPSNVPLWENLGAREPEALGVLGAAYFQGTPSLQRDSTLARKYAEQACGRGGDSGCAILAAIYQAGDGVTQDYALAAKYYGQGCDGDSATACAALSQLHVQGQGVPKDLDKARGLAEKACSRREQSCWGLGYLHLMGFGVARDPARAVDLYQRACGAGSAEACMRLGAVYHEGIGVGVDDAKARGYLQAGCAGGAAMACRVHGILLFKGSGGAPDPQAAERQFERGCAGRDPPSCSLVATIFLDRGIPAELARARELGTFACDSDITLGCTVLGVLLANGLGGEPDLPRARIVLRKACTAGDIDGCRLAKEVAK